MLFRLLVPGIVVLGTQVVRSASFKFKFSTIEQCEPLSISFFNNDNGDPIPSTLTLLPFSSNPVSIPIPNAAANSTGVSVSFLPFPAGTQFIASLDDENGDNSARVSDIFRVLDSPTGNTSCLPTFVPTPLFTLPNSVAQCENFTVSYQESAPNVRVLAPNGGSFPLDVVLDDMESKSAVYMMNVTRGQEVVLMLVPGSHTELGMTSPLLTGVLAYDDVVSAV